MADKIDEYIDDYIRNDPDNFFRHSIPEDVANKLKKENEPIFERGYVIFIFT